MEALKGDAPPIRPYVLRDAPGWRWMANGRDNEGRFDFLVVDDVAYGSGPLLHIHATQEDSFYVLQGVLTVQLDDEVVELGPGDFATAPPGVAHSFTNASPEQPMCRGLNLLTPGIGFDRYLERLERAAARGDHESSERLNAEFGVTVVGPSVAERLGLSRA
jgi:anti-sigma factor ChrR (cupin superfamily)